MSGGNENINLKFELKAWGDGSGRKKLAGYIGWSFSAGRWI